MNKSRHKNVTFSLPEALLRRFRVYAASVKAKRRFLERIESAPDRGTNGVIRWSPEDLHEH